MLEGAGVRVAVQPAVVDEAAIRSDLQDDNPDIEPQDVAEVLARAKAEQVSAANPGVLVIGADQVLACGGEIFAKPPTVEAARDQLLRLRGLAHSLPTAVVLAIDGETVWSHLEEPILTMRPVSDSFIAAYLATEGEAVCETVGGYKLEGLGAQMFDSVDGDYFSIVGLPLLPLLAELRLRKVIST
jgi:septum formation protein